MSGGASPRRRGDYFERQTARDLALHGWLVVRVAGSGSGSQDSPLEGTGTDLLAITASHPPLLISCKLGGRIPPDERQALAATAKRYGAVPVVASRPKNGVVLYRGLRPDDADTSITR